MALVAAGAAVVGPMMANHTHQGLHEFAQVFPNMSHAVFHFQLVRYATVACLAGAGWERLILNSDKRITFWPFRLSAPKILYIFNRYLNLCCLCLDVYIYTSTTAESEECMMWFNFRSEAMIILMFVIETLVAFHLWAFNDRSKGLAAFCMTTIIAQLAMCTSLLGVHMKQVMSTPRPGIWFHGCFPVFSGHMMWPGWNSTMWLLLIFTGFATRYTFRSWRTARMRNQGLSFWNHAISCGLLHYIGITAGIWFCGLWWMTASISLVTIAPTLASTIISVLGCRLMLTISEREELFYPRNNILEAIGVEQLGKHELRVVNDSSATSFGELGISDRKRMDYSKDGSPVPVVSIELDELTSRSDAATLTPALMREATDLTSMNTHGNTGFSSRSDVQLVPSPSQTYNDGIESTSPVCPNVQDLEAGYGQSGPSTSPLQYWHDPTEVIYPSTPPLEPMTFAAPTPPASPDIIPFEPTLSRRRYIIPNHTINEEDVEDDLDRALAEQYDEDGRRKRPKRTHQRRWKSDDVLPQSPYNSYAPTSSSPLNMTVFPVYTTPSGRPLSSPISPSRAFSPTPSSNASRHRLSSLLHWNHSTRTTLPEEEDGMSSRSVARSLPRSGNSASSHAGCPVTGGILGTRRSVLSRSSRARAESDVRTISSASTDWVFDNTHVLEVPDFE